MRCDKIRWSCRPFSWSTSAYPSFCIHVFKAWCCNRDTKCSGAQFLHEPHSCLYWNTAVQVCCVEVFIRDPCQSLLRNMRTYLYVSYYAHPHIHRKLLSVLQWNEFIWVCRTVSHHTGYWRASCLSMGERSPEWGCANVDMTVALEQHFSLSSES